MYYIARLSQETATLVTESGCPFVEDGEGLLGVEPELGKGMPVGEDKEEV